MIGILSPQVFRTELRLEGKEVFAAADIRRGSDGSEAEPGRGQWGEVTSMVMTDSCGAAAECHDRMPVLLAARDYGAWLGEMEAEAKALCVPYAGPVAVERTGELWKGNTYRVSWKFGIDKCMFTELGEHCEAYPVRVMCEATQKSSWIHR